MEGEWAVPEKAALLHRMVRKGLSEMVTFE